MMRRPADGQIQRFSGDAALRLLFVLLFSLALLFNIWRAPFGYFTRDESLYLAIPYRLMQGDILLVHEWNLSQMSAVLLLPLVRLYLAVFGSTDGIALFFRYVYIFFHSLVALYIYVRLSGLRLPGSRIAALIASVLYELYCYHAVMALSYNSIRIGLLTACLLTAATCRKPREMLFAGFMLAGAVLCYPYLASIYILYSAVVFVPALRPGSPEAEIAFSRKSWLLVTGACLFSAFAFLAPILLSGKAGLLSSTIPQILADQQHPKRSLRQLVVGYFSSFYRFNGNGRIVLIGGVLLAAVFFLDKKRRAHRPVYLAVAAALAVLFSLTYLLMYRYDEGFIFSFTLMSLFACLLTEKRCSSLFAIIFLPSLVHSFCAYTSSNLELISIMAAMTTALPAAALFLVSVVLELWDQARCERGAGRAAALCGCVLASMFTCYIFYGVVDERMEDVFFDSPPWELSAVFEEGSSRGLKSTPERVAATDSAYRALAPLRETEEGNVLYLSTDSRLYLEDPKRCSSFSMWFWTANPAEYNAQRLNDYWSLFPEKRPDYIYFDPEQSLSEEYLTAFAADQYSQMPLGEGLVLCLENQ